MGRSKASFKNAVPLHDLTQGFGPDIYENLHKHNLTPMAQQLILRARNKPSSLSRLHILVPTGSRGVNQGDVGLLDREAAIQEGRSTMPDGFRITTKNITARELFTSGDLNKWFWNPGKTEQ
jgi:hypothetical protein